MRPERADIHKDWSISFEKAAYMTATSLPFIPRQDLQTGAGSYIAAPLFITPPL
jgi:hypothetical protein